MTVAGNIVIELSIDDAGLPITVSRAGAVLRRFQTSLDQTAGSVRRLENAHDSLSTKFRHFVMTAGNLRFVMMDINDLFFRLPSAIIRSAGELERMQFLMTGLSRATNKAARDAEGLRDFKFVTGMAKNAPFEISALSDAFVKLKTAGMDPTSGSMQALVDSVARFGGTGESLKRASIAIQQMAGKGVVSMEELRQQLGEAVPTAMQDMADAMGVSMADLAKIVKTGTLATGPAVAKMLLQMRMNNEGASAEMMQTWTGHMAKLKTEWALTSKFVSDNGLGAGAKQAINELVGAMQNADFRRFAGDAGAGMGEVVRSLIQGVQALVKYREEIGLMIQAWLAYKVVASLVIPLSSSINANYSRMSGTLRQHASDIVNAASQRRATALAELAQISATRTAEQARLSAKLAADRVELASNTAKLQAITAEHARMQAVMNSTAGGVRVPGFTGFQKRGVGEYYLRDQARQASQLTAANVALNNSLAANAAAMTTVTAAAGPKVAALQRVAGAGALARAAMVASTAATTAFSGAMSLLGGPVGVAIIAIMGLVYWWQKVAGAAKDAEDRQRRAANFTSSVEDLKADQQAVKDAQERLDSEKGMFESLSSDRTKASIEKAQKDLTLAKERLKNTEKVVNENLAKEGAASIVEGANRKVQAIKEAGSMEQLALTDEQNKALKTLKENTKEHTAKKAQFTEQRKNSLVGNITQRIKSVSEEEDRAAAAARAAAGAERSKQLQAVEQLAELRKQLEADLKGVKGTIAKEIIHKPIGGKKKGAGDTGPVVEGIDTYIAQLKARQAKLRATLPGLLDDLGKTDAAAAALAELNQKFEDKRWTKKDKKGREIGPGQTQIADARRLVEQNANLETLLGDAKRIAGEVNKMQPDYDQAMRVLASPLSEVGGANANQFDEIIAKLKSAPEDFKEIGAAAGVSAKSVGELIAKMNLGKSMAGTIDISAGISEMAKANRKTAIDIVQDERQRVALQIVEEERLAKARDDLRVEDARKAGVAANVIAQYQKEAAEGALLRAQDAALKMRTPLEKLTDDWGRAMSKMDDASARWADNFIDSFAKFTETGRFTEFKTFLNSILTDLVKIQAQKTMGDSINTLLGNGTEWLKKNMPGLATPNPDTGDLPLDARGARGTEALARATELATGGLKSFLSNGVEASTASMVTALTGKAQEAAAVASFSATLASATNALHAFIGSLRGASGAGGGSGGMSGIMSSLFGAGPSASATGPGMMEELVSLGVFAKGGVTSALGPLKLRKYAAGGIARGPQLSLYGEAGPEAFVPLPDGRSIPVSLKMAQQPGTQALAQVMAEFSGVLRSGLTEMSRAAVAGAQVNASAIMESQRSVSAAPVPARSGGDVMVNIYNSTGEKVTRTEQTDSRGRRNVNVVIGEMVASELRRPGSSVDQGMRSGFGLGPSIVRR